MSNQPNWKWDTSTEVRNKKCHGCSKSMFIDIHHAVIYENKNWHLHCLLDMLTEHHSGIRVDPGLELFDDAYKNAP